MKRTLMLFPTERSRNWLDLPDELMALILARLVTVDRIMIARKVCNTWRRICSDPALWRVVVLEYCISWNIVNVAKKAVDLSCGQLIDIRINDIGTDSLLRYISDRSNQLRRLHLSSCDNITSEGLSEMFKKLPLLEELHLDYTAISPQAIEVTGRYCPLLKSFKLNNHGHLHAFNMNYAGPNEDALAIAKHLPGLRHLQLTGNNMTIVGLVAITENCSHLESLDISDCLNVADQLGSDLRKRLSQQIKDLRLPLHSSRDYRYGNSMLNLDDTFMFPGNYGFDTVMHHWEHGFDTAMHHWHYGFGTAMHHWEHGFDTAMHHWHYGFGTAMNHWEDNLMFPGGIFYGAEFDGYNLFADYNAVQYFGG